MKPLVIVLILLLNVGLFAQSSNLEEKLADYQMQLANKISIGSSIEEVKSKLGKPTAVEAGFPESDELIFFDEFNSDQAGQLNYTTWFYKLAKKKVSYTVYADTSFFINGEDVPFNIYQYYSNKDSVYYYATCYINDNLVSLQLYNYYLDKDSVYNNIHDIIDYFPSLQPPDLHRSEPKRPSSSKSSKKITMGQFVKKESQTCTYGKLVMNKYELIEPEAYYLLSKKASQEIKINKQHTISDTFLPILCIIFEKGTNVVASTKVYFQWL